MNVLLEALVDHVLGKFEGIDLSTRTHWRDRKLWRPSLSVISAAFMAFYQIVSYAGPSGVRGVIRSSMSTYRKILLVGENQQAGVAQLVLVQHALELLTGLNNTVAIVAVDDKDDTLGVLEVVPPQRTDLVLATDIPHGEGDVLVLHSLDVETLVKSELAQSATNEIEWTKHRCGI